MGTLNDEIIRVTGGPTVSDGLRSFCIDNGGATVAAVVAAGGTLNDILRAFLNFNGVTYGPLNDMWVQFLAGLGFVGTRDDMEYQWWLGGASIIPTPLAVAGLVAWYDPSDMSTMFQDSLGTIPVTDQNQPVGLITDKSGNNFNGRQTTAAARPTLKQDGNGNWYLLFDGIDDHLNTDIAGVIQPWTRISALSQLSWTLGDAIFGSSTSQALLLQSGASPQLNAQSGNTIVVPGVYLTNPMIIEELANSASSLVRLNQNADTLGNLGTGGIPDMVIGLDPNSPTKYGNFGLYGTTVYSSALSLANRNIVNAYLNSKSGAY